MDVRVGEKGWFIKEMTLVRHQPDGPVGPDSGQRGSLEEIAIRRSIF